MMILSMRIAIATALMTSTTFADNHGEGTCSCVPAAVRYCVVRVCDTIAYSLTFLLSTKVWKDLKNQFFFVRDEVVYMQPVYQAYTIQCAHPCEFVNTIYCMDLLAGLCASPLNFCIYFLDIFKISNVHGRSYMILQCHTVATRFAHSQSACDL